MTPGNKSPLYSASFMRALGQGLPSSSEGEVHLTAHEHRHRSFFPHGCWSTILIVSSTFAGEKLPSEVSVAPLTLLELSSEWMALFSLSFMPSEGLVCRLGGDMEHKVLHCG